ncbi:MAG: homing endonuclease associated repeat-containing protein, partial [Exiguobacterium acetylicum]
MKKWTEQQVIDSLIEASIEYPALDAKTYARWSIGKDIPSITTIINVFGSWREALQAAGLSSIRPYFSDEEILAFIKEASTRLHPYHRNSYREWAKAKHGPSLTLINLRFGSWSR